MEDIDELVFVPTEKDKERINKLCNKVIDLLDGLTTAEKAFALTILIDSFEKSYGIKMTAILDRRR